MKTTQGNTLTSLRAVQTFLAENAESLGTVVHTGARRALDDVLVELVIHSADQDASAIAARGSTQRQRALTRALLRHHVAPIARIARLYLVGTPALEPFRMPHRRWTNAKIAAASVGMGRAAEPYSVQFVDTRLADAAHAMLQSHVARAQSWGMRSGATTGLKTELQRGRRIVSVLDAFVHTALDEEPILLASWNTVKRVPTN